MHPRNASKQRNRDAGAWQLRSIVPVVALMVRRKSRVGQRSTADADGNGSGEAVGSEGGRGMRARQDGREQGRACGHGV